MTIDESKTKILVDDADVFISDDSNFIQAIWTLAQTSHKPNLLTEANEEAFWGLQVFCKKVSLRKHLIHEVETLTYKHITKHKTVNREIISNIAEKRNFHYALKALWDFLENEISEDIF